MTLLDKVLQANFNFLEEYSEEKFQDVSKYPKHKLAIVTCMDARLVTVSSALGLNRGDVKIIKNAGNSVIGTFGETVRSLVVAVFALGVEEIMILGHFDCGVANTNSKELIDKMLERNISEDAIKLVEDDLKQWLDNYKNPVQNVIDVVRKIYENPLIPKDIPIHGLIINPDTNKLTVVVNGYNKK